MTVLYVQFRDLAVAEIGPWTVRVRGRDPKDGCLIGTFVGTGPYDHFAWRHYAKQDAVQVRYHKRAREAAARDAVTLPRDGFVSIPADLDRARFWSLIRQHKA